MLMINVTNPCHSWHQLFVVMKYMKHLLDNCLFAFNVLSLRFILQSLNFTVSKCYTAI